MEGHDMVLWFLTCLTLKLRDVIGELGRHGGHAGSCRMGSLVNLARSGRLRLAMYGKLDRGCDTKVGWITLGPMPPSGGVM